MVLYVRQACFSCTLELGLQTPPPPRGGGGGCLVTTLKGTRAMSWLATSRVFAFLCWLPDFLLKW